jgi:hypothetical protein
MDDRCWILDTGYWILDTGYWMIDAGLIFRRTKEKWYLERFRENKW